MTEQLMTAALALLWAGIGTLAISDGKPARVALGVVLGVGGCGALYLALVGVR